MEIHFAFRKFFLSKEAMSDSPKQDFDYDILAKPPRHRMNKKRLTLPISVIAFLVLLLAPVIHSTVIITCPDGGWACQPIGGQPLPNGGFTYSFYESVTFALFKFGGTVNTFGTLLYSTTSIFNLVPLGVLILVVLPLAIAAAVGFKLAFSSGKKRKL